MRDTTGEVMFFYRPPLYTWTGQGCPASRTYLQQLCADSLRDLPIAMNNRDGWGERVKEMIVEDTFFSCKWYEIVIIELISA